MWRAPVSLALGFLRPLALRGSAWWSPSPGWCSIQSSSRTSVLPFLTLTHPLTVTYSSCGVGSGVKLLWWFVYVLCLLPSASTPLLLHIPPSGSMIEIVLIKYSGNCIIGNVIFKLKYISIYLPEYLIHTRPSAPLTRAFRGMKGKVW